MSPDPELPTEELGEGPKVFGREVSVRSIVRILVALLLVGIPVAIIKLQPIAPNRQAAVNTLRAELAQLAPFPGSVAYYTITVADIFEPYTGLEVFYSSPGQCSDIQAYYATQAQAVGWSMQGPVQTYQKDFNPDHNGLRAAYQKDAQGYTIGLIIDCFVDQTYQGGYDLFLDIPPQP